LITACIGHNAFDMWCGRFGKLSWHANSTSARLHCCTVHLVNFAPPGYRKKRQSSAACLSTKSTTRSEPLVNDSNQRRELQLHN